MRLALLTATILAGLTGWLAVWWLVGRAIDWVADQLDGEDFR